uniref:Methyltransferase domain-containing protein n=1 Tax=Craspedostauros australis TaxID=1486917 RepID=A0A7R9ZHN6_9STRA|mmetsp:Transcript_1006/g.2926  ORF Transcript_1006/g.2926 Transcript_1006/m.2926 type:complete len:212 (+) Transcript_1006:193-828(+)|eukprot:CAMPEP_0198119046 /NCGR_PEP_ID=MMETSP1442-20131203/24093_1 /TAXON_ID= /ORGANISM="Craspedostauros australis, Strain CCMP3328" /LENGTH=211 /DNA_ID=CAMNT_0043777431 /DNA_START=107 /DNA_END=742 /DNA_ORIENTATION=+
MKGNFWDERYGKEAVGDDFAYGKQPNDFLAQTVESMKLTGAGKRCLLLADGEGRNGVFMAKQGYQVVSVDFSKVGMDKAQRLAKDECVTIETIVADLAQYDLGTQKWDCIVGISCHLPAPIRTKVLEAIPASLKPGGRFILECYTPKQLEFKTGGPPGPEMMYSSDILSKAFGSALVTEKNEEIVREVVEGTYHTGKAAVVQFIGKKEGAE